MDTPTTPPPDIPGITHPISIADAQGRAYGGVGTMPLRVLWGLRNEWWSRLRAATTPEEKVTCERMINALGEAIGLHQHEKGKALADANSEGRSVVRLHEADQRAVDRWR